MRLPRPFFQMLTVIASLGAVPFAHATSGDSTPFLLDTRNYDDSTPLFSVDTRAPDLIANMGITDSGGTSFTITMGMLQVTGGGTITFTLVTEPVHGTLLLDGIVQDAGATFTQAQIDAGLLSYQRAAGDPLADTFAVAAMDDDAGLLGGNLTFAVAGIPGASGTLFLVDTRNFSGSAAHTVHTDNRAYLTVDTVPGSLRQAIANVAAGETVDFDTGLSGGTVTLGGSQLLLDKSLTIEASDLPGGVTISGGNSSRVFSVSAPEETVALKGLAIRNGSAGNGAGISVSGGSLIVTDSTISDNVSSGLGGGVFMDSGASSLTVRNSTLADNVSAGNGGAINNNGATLIITSSTIVGNSAAFGGGIQMDGSAPSVTLENSIVAGNTAPTGPDVHKTSGMLTPVGANLIGINTTVSSEFPSGPLAGTAALPVDPLLAPLGDYGGPTATMALAAGSPAIDAGGTTVLTSDQRGFPRTVGSAPDLGAYESGNAAGYAVWAVEIIPAGLDASFTGDAEGDGSANGAEYALGTAVLISDPGAANNYESLLNPAGEVEISFGLNPAALLDTRWVIKRTTDLENYTEIYRYDGPTTTSTEGANVTATVGATSITVTDEDPPSPKVFYRLEMEQR